MNRKKFLIASGTLVTATILSNYVFSQPSNAESDVRMRRPDPDQFIEPILKAITLGLNAPNPHNTQAWKFRILNDKEALFYVDEKKTLPETDPPARQIHIGCGCFIAIFKIGASHLGYEASVEYLPDGNYGFDEIGNKPVAKLSLHAVDQKPDPLFKHIYNRQTNRTLYTGELLTNEDFNNILRLSSPTYAKVQITNNKQGLRPMLELLYKGMKTECYDWNAYDETRRWFRVKDDISTKRDGINVRTGGMRGIQRWLVETMLSNYSKKVWHNESGIQSFLKTYHETLMSSGGVVTFTTASNELLDWIKCGEDYARFQLAAYDQGFYIHPLSQVLQEFPSMKKHYEDFNQMMNVTPPAKVQMVVRIGRGDSTEYAYRKNTNDFMVKEQNITHG
jgi:hypothetical protein